MVSSVKHFPDGNIRNKFWNAILTYSKEVKGNLEFVSELLLIFNENTKDFFNFSKISMILRFHKAFIFQNFRYEIPTYETHNKYFNLLVMIYLLELSDIKMRSLNDLNNLKRKSYSLIFNTMVFKDLIKSHRKEEFDILFTILFIINRIRKAQSNVIFERFELVDLSENVSNEGYRYLFSDNFRKNYSLKRQCLKLYSLMKQIHSFDVQGCNKVIEKIKNYLEKWRERDYHESWQYLYPLHIKDFILFTLGLNIKNLQFFEDARLELFSFKDKKIYIYRIDIDRHHLDYDSEYYLPFDFSQKFGFMPKLAPLSHGDHTRITNLIKTGLWDNVVQITNLYRARLIHLFELIFRSYSFRKDFSFDSEFRNKTARINGKEIYIWSGINSQTIKEWTSRWNNRKSMSEPEFLTTYYNIFYKNKFIKYLKEIEKENPAFWYWYTNFYIKERKNLLGNLSKFYGIY